MGSGLIAAGVKCVGRGHIKTATPCQDSVAIKLVGEGGYIALADGAGSRAHSDLGSQICVDSIVRYLSKNFDVLFKLSQIKPEEVRKTLVNVILVAMKRHVCRKNYGIEDMACTLLFAAVKNGQILAGHLGDGVIGIQNGDEISVLSFPENGEFANSTYFVTDKGAQTRLRLYHSYVTEKVGVVLMSDGTAESLFNRTTRKLAPAASTIFGWANRISAKKLRDVLDQNLKQVFITKTTDDCSMAIVVSR